MDVKGKEDSNKSQIDGLLDLLNFSYLSILLVTHYMN